MREVGTTVTLQGLFHALPVRHKVIPSVAQFATSTVLADDDIQPLICLQNASRPLVEKLQISQRTHVFLSRLFHHSASVIIYSPIRAFFSRLGLYKEQDA